MNLDVFSSYLFDFLFRISAGARLRGMPAGRGRGNLVPNAARTMTYQSIIASRGILKKRRRGVLFSYNSPVLQALGRVS